ncbi:bifunctional folylpolyglutamate synthase/dihydrofolate synthase [Corynebacterium uterequi]|uniref:bifunctional folylpolyglutamate synthase/dihydrofolate synthase n=1 Tax=Corynebacterium uterequi TaxID=1072256 RepID=UPI000640C82A
MELFADADTEFGRVVVGQEGLTLNLGESHVENPDTLSRDVTEADERELARVEAQLAARALETDPNPSLDRIAMLVDLLGDPQHSYPAIHIAGTNGKTSTARMIDSLLQAFHRRTGLFTSPHLQRITECIAIDGAEIHPGEFAAQHDEIAPLVDMVDHAFAARGQAPMSRYEVLVGVALSAFADAPVDVAVVETGMGGTWDATNVVDGDVAVITPIGLDHQGFLGETLTEIASHKAGIITSRWDASDLLTPPDNVAIIGRQEPEALRVLAERAIEVDAAVARMDSEFAVLSSTVAVGGQMLTLQGLGGVYEDLFLPLAGEHQAHNAAVALAAVEAFFGAGSGRPLDIARVREGFAAVTTPGRLERVRTTPSTFVDAAHNRHGASALAAALDRDFEFSRLVGVVGVLADKDAAGILTELEPHLAEVVCTQPVSPRALDAYDLADQAREIFGEERVHVVDSLPSAYALAVELAEDAEIQSGAGIIITGSVVTAGQARALLVR